MVELRHAGAFLYEAHIRANVTRHTEQRPGSEPGWAGSASRHGQSHGLTRRSGERMTVQTKSLYDQLGGQDVINALTESWVARMRAMTGPAGSSRGSASRGSKEAADQLCAATGGPCTYTGRYMRDTHAGMKTTVGEFDVVMQHLGAAGVVESISESPYGGTEWPSTRERPITPVSHLMAKAASRPEIQIFAGHRPSH
jgi:truncated hemoglobin YjbI